MNSRKSRLIKKSLMTHFLFATLLVLTIQLFISPGSAQLSVSQSLIHNGDFSNGLTGWTPGVLKPSGIKGYPRWGSSNGTLGDWGNVHWGSGGMKHSAYLDVPGGATAYLESDLFKLPDKEGEWTLDLTLGGAKSPTMLQVQLKTQIGIYTLDSFETPKIELGQQPAIKHYSIPSNFTSQNIAVRFTCADVPPYHDDGVYCIFGGIPTPSSDIPTSALVVVATGLAVAGTAIVAAYLASQATEATQAGHSKGFLSYLASLAIAVAARLIGKPCCACTGACNHTGPHSFCPAHDPRTLYSRMQIVNSIYCRFCGKKLGECKTPTFSH